MSPTSRTGTAASSGRVHTREVSGEPGQEPLTGPEARADEDPAVAALALLFTANRMLTDSMDRALRAVCGLSTAQVEVLVTLGVAPEGRLRMADIARAVGVSRSGTTQIVDRLVLGCFVDRMVGAADRRTVWAAITDAGRQILRDTHPVFAAEAHRHLTTRLSGEQVALLREALDRLVNEEPGPAPAGGAIPC